jgi:hypothetical protein
MKLVNAAILHASGLTSDDIDDFCYADAYESGRRPVSVAREALAAAGFSEA